MIPFRGRERILGYALIGLAVVLVLGPFVYVVVNSIKYQIAIYTGAWVFTPTLSNYVDVLFSRRSDFAGNVVNSLVVAAVSTVRLIV